MSAPRVLVCGDRHWEDRELIYLTLEEYPPGTVIIEGEANGADKMAGACARSLGFEVLSFPAEWDLYGRAAGPIRNKQQLDEGQPTEGLAFHDFLDESKGTIDMLRRLVEADVPFRIVSHTEVI